MGEQKWRKMDAKRHNKEKVQSSKAPSTEAPVQKKAPRLSEGQPLYEVPPQGQPVEKVDKEEEEEDEEEEDEEAASHPQWRRSQRRHSQKKRGWKGWMQGCSKAGNTMPPDQSKSIHNQQPD